MLNKEACDCQDAEYQYPIMVIDLHLYPHYNDNIQFSEHSFIMRNKR